MAFSTQVRPVGTGPSSIPHQTHAGVQRICAAQRQQLQHTAASVPQVAASAAGACGSGSGRARRAQACRPVVLARASAASDVPADAGADGIVFGKPQAPKEVYEGIVREARKGLMGEVAKGDAGMDCVLAALHLASEDDAIKTRTHIPLPVDSFSGRLDTVVAECAASMPKGAEPAAQLAHVISHLHNVWGLKVAQGMTDGAFSPYRVYMHNVLAQRCGTQVACATVLDAMLARLHVRGDLAFRAQVGMPQDPKAFPVAGLPQGPGGPLPISAEGAVDAASVQWMGGQQLLASCLDQLKRFFWSWDWPLDAPSGFEACAQALLGAGGRAGRVNAAVGVMQARGRPYGNVELALLASERAVLVLRQAAPGSWGCALQERDFAAQLLHVGRREEGRTLLAEHAAWLDGQGAKAAPATGAYKDLLSRVLLAEQRAALEGAFAASPGLGGPEGGTSGFLDPDRDA